MKPYTFFNSICIGGCVFFLCATFFVWNRAGASGGTLYDPKVTTVSFAEVNREKLEMGNDVLEIQNGESEERLGEFVPSSIKEVVVESDIVEDVQEDVVLPPSFNLAVPFTSQAPEKNWDQPWQDACEEAAILMLDAYYKGYGLSPLFAKDELLKMVVFEEEKNWGGSIEIEKVREVAAFYLFGNGKWKMDEMGLTILENPTIEQIKIFVAQGHPVYAVAYGKDLPNPHFVNGGPEYHALIIRGYTETTFITNDPGTQFGENFEYKYSDLMQAIHDWNDGNPKEGQSVVMVLR